MVCRTFVVSCLMSFGEEKAEGSACAGHDARGVRAQSPFMLSGPSAGLLRQATYTTTRLGVYNILLDRVKSVSHTHHHQNPHLAQTRTCSRKRTRALLPSPCAMQ